MDDKTLINPFLILIKKTGKYVRAYEDWIAKPDADKTYVNLKEFWRKEHLKMKRTNPSASAYGYGMNATAEPATDQQDMAIILEQCVNAMMNTQREPQNASNNLRLTWQRAWPHCKINLIKQRPITKICSPTPSKITPPCKTKWRARPKSK